MRRGSLGDDDAREERLELLDPVVLVWYEHARLELVLVDVGREAGVVLRDDAVECVQKGEGARGAHCILVVHVSA